MAHVIAAPCIADYSCVAVCPVQCISPHPTSADFGETEQLYIDPQACIDCGACITECPVSAIYEAGNLPGPWQHYADINRQYFEITAAAALP